MFFRLWMRDTVIYTLPELPERSTTRACSTQFIRCFVEFFVIAVGATLMRWLSSLFAFVFAFASSTKDHLFFIQYARISKTKENHAQLHTYRLHEIYKNSLKSGCAEAISDTIRYGRLTLKGI